jgi:hypothetical protein
MSDDNDAASTTSTSSTSYSLDRYLALPPDEEPASTSAIQTAMEAIESVDVIFGTVFNQPATRPAIGLGFRTIIQDVPDDAAYQEANDSFSDIQSDSNGSSVSSAGSNLSAASRGSKLNRSRCRGRKRYLSNPYDATKKNKSPERTQTLRGV